MKRNKVLTYLLFLLLPLAVGGLAALVTYHGMPVYEPVSYTHLKFVLPVLSVFNTIPGIVFVGLLFIWLGMQPATVLIALSIYAMFPILKNTYAGLVSVDPQYIEAARGCGMTPYQRLYKIEIPLALPTIIGGLRMSTIYTVSWTVLAADVYKRQPVHHWRRGVP